MQRREGRTPIVEAAADLFASATLEEVASFVGPRAVAAASGKATGTITYHFSAGQGRELRLAALQRALERTGAAELALQEELTAALNQITVDGEVDDAVSKVAAALARELGWFSPADQPIDATVEAEETAAFLGAAVAPRDEDAAKLLRDFTAPHVETHAWICAELAQKLQRRWTDGLSPERFGLATNSLASGFLWTRRFAPEQAPLDLYADMYIKLFAVCTAPEGSPRGDDDRGDLLTEYLQLPKTGLGRSKRAIVEAANRLYDQEGWDAVTVSSVAPEAEVSRPTVVSNLRNRNGLAAAVWSRHLPALAETLESADSADAATFLQALSKFLLALARVSRLDIPLTRAFLDGVFGYSVEQGRLTSDDPADPRNLVPLTSMLVPLVERNVALFRPGNAGDPDEVMETAAMMITQTLHLAVTQPSKDIRHIVNRVLDTTVSGMLLERPALEGNQLREGN